MFHDLRYCCRSLWKSPGFTLLAVITLSVGIGATSVIFSLVYSMAFRPLPYADSDRLVRILWQWKSGYGGGVVPALADAVAQRNHSFSSVATVFPSTGCNLTGGDSAEYVIDHKVSAGFFGTLGVNMALGRDFISEDAAGKESAVAIISYSLWQRHFHGDSSAIGEALKCNGQPLTIVGVLPRTFNYVKRGDVWVPARLANYLNDQGMNYGVIARLRPGADVIRAREDLASIFQQVRSEMPKKWWTGKNARGMAILPYREWQFGELRQPIMVLAGAVVLVLLIACANIAGLLVVRTRARMRDTAVRLALGAKRTQLLRQFLIETTVISFLGGVAGLLLAWWLLHSLQMVIPTSTGFLGIESLDALGLGITLPVSIFILALSLFTGLFSALIPGIALTSLKFQDALKLGERAGGTSRTGQRSRKLLLASEVAVSFVLLVGSTLLVRSFIQLQNVSLGFRPANLQVLQLSFSSQKYKTPESIDSFQQRTMEGLRSLPGVVAVAGVSSVPLESGLNLPAPDADGKSCTTDGTVDYRAVTPGYFAVMGAPLLHGREIQPGDSAGSARVVVVNQTLARMCWPGQDPIGKQVWIGKNQAQLEDYSREVIGVVADLREYSLDVDAPPMAFVPQTQIKENINGLLYQSFNLISAFMIRTSGPADLSVGARRTVAAVDPEQPVISIMPMQRIVGDSIAFSRLIMLLMGIFAGLAVLLTAVGLYGLFSYYVTVRSHEIGVRMALGAARSHILYLVLREAILLALAGSIVGLVGAFAETRLLRSLLFGVTPVDPIAFLLSLATLMLVILMASYLPIRRAMKVDPILVLRYE